MMVGTCAMRPAPTTSPTAVTHRGHRFGLHLFRHAVAPGAPSPWRVDRVLDVAIEVEAPRAAFPADPGLAGAPEGGAQVPDEEAVDPDRPRSQPGRYPLGSGLVAGESVAASPYLGLLARSTASSSPL